MLQSLTTGPLVAAADLLSPPSSLAVISYCQPQAVANSFLAAAGVVRVLQPALAAGVAACNGTPHAAATSMVASGGGGAPGPHAVPPGGPQLGLLATPVVEARFQEKLRLEKKQRTVRRLRKEAGVEYHSRWFRQVGWGLRGAGEREAGG
ncbi:hypothetical protein TSOC_011478 [Tetrabaena socialis]|uniref:Uncharacterized protein n=1 Tax=Tetrabaena socialis TaxID=47790 RepID=A0A2J7ZQI5_9CHLO|nr:hypothetical protein TSOC_011478 [Tetrabaena socialis]|eukprot:PNH02533.1 hypothetical protein TSOC_011478 [Tetrabaena socialis]